MRYSLSRRPTASAAAITKDPSACARGPEATRSERFSAYRALNVHRVTRMAHMHYCCADVSFVLAGTKVA